MLAQDDRCENMNCLCGKRPWRKPKPSRRSKRCGNKNNISADISTHNMMIFCDKFALWIFGFRFDAPIVAWRITHKIPNWHVHVMQISHKSYCWLHTAKDYSGLTKGMRLYAEAGGPIGQKMDDAPIENNNFHLRVLAGTTLFRIFGRGFWLPVNVNHRVAVGLVLAWIDRDNFCQQCILEHCWSILGPMFGPCWAVWSGQMVLTGGLLGPSWVTSEWVTWGWHGAVFGHIGGHVWLVFGLLHDLYWASSGATLYSVKLTETFGLYSLTCYSTAHYLEYCICFSHLFQPMPCATWICWRAR